MLIWLYISWNEIQVLIDPLKRSFYNDYGEEGLKGHRASSSQPGQNGFPFDRASCYRPRSAEDIFAEFFGSKQFDFGPMWRSASTNFSSGSQPENRQSNSRSVDGGVSSGGASNYPAQNTTTIENTLLCSLEELYTGSKRRMKISRKGIDAFTGYLWFFFINFHYFLSIFAWFFLIS